MKKTIVYTSLLIATGLYAQSNGSCSTGTTKYSDTGKIYGCVEGKWRPLSETYPTLSINITDDFQTQRFGNTVYAKENGKVYDMKNVGFTPIDIDGVEHQIGKIIYSSTNKHFYQGVENGKWWQLDNEPINGNLRIQPERYIISVKDDDYYPINTLDLSSQPLKAELGSKNADNKKDPSIDYQGIIGRCSPEQEFNLSQRGLDNYPKEWKWLQTSAFAHTYTVNITGVDYNERKKLPTILSTALIPAKYIKNSNKDEVVYLKVTEESNYRPYICADKKLELVQLDMNKGIGQDGKGVLLTSFSIDTYNKSQTMDLRLLPAIPDRNANKTTQSYAGSWANDLYEHEMFYMPITGPDGETWLNNNLGAYYSTLALPFFYPLQQAKSKLDRNAYGSFFQWQRKADGHELIDWREQNERGILGDVQYDKKALKHPWNDAETFRFIAVEAGFPAEYGWIINPSENVPLNLWQAKGENNPCPVGYQVPTYEQQKALHFAIVGADGVVSKKNNRYYLVKNDKMWNDDTQLKLPASGHREDWIYGTIAKVKEGSYWSSSGKATNNEDISGTLMVFKETESGTHIRARTSVGFAVRCIKN